MNYIFVATETAVGEKVIIGPKTGKRWQVTPQGSWVLDEFERTERYLLGLDITRYCSKTRSMIETKIYLVDPSFDQMETMPTD